MEQPSDLLDAAVKGHVAMERGKRLSKARKIVNLLGMDLDGKSVLDLGTGSGVIAEYLTSQGAKVTAADRDIGACVFEGSDLVRLESLSLPFTDHSFDAIIFNHVIEHVGDRPDQEIILAEIRRCLRPGGKLYLAVPNKWALIEPHYKLPLLGALPRYVSNALVSKLGRHPFYDCYPFTRGELAMILKKHFEAAQDISADAYFWAANNEIGGPIGKLLGKVPESLVRAMSGSMPTLIFVCTKVGQR